MLSRKRQQGVAGREVSSVAEENRNVYVYTTQRDRERSWGMGAEQSIYRYTFSVHVQKKKRRACKREGMKRRVRWRSCGHQWRG